MAESATRKIPEVLNRYKASPLMAGAIYIGRPSVYGNPFVIGRDGSRAEVIAQYEEWLLKQPELVALIKVELRGRNLKCYCAPQPCHGDVLLRIANEEAT